MKIRIAIFFAALILALPTMAQVPMNTLIKISNAEDSRNAEPLADLLNSANVEIRRRSALAAGRVGREDAIPALRDLLEKDPSVDVRVTAAFALGEIESTKAADSIVKVIKDKATDKSVLARSVEAAGKIAAANPADPRSGQLSRAIVEMLEAEFAKGESRQKDCTLMAITAILRTRPATADETVAKFLDDPVPRVRADALNTLSRMRSKQRLSDIRTMMVRDPDPVVRANAARALSVDENKETGPMVLQAALKDKDSRVRVSAIRTLAAIKSTDSLTELKKRAGELFGTISKASKPGFNASEKSEFLEIAATIGRLAQGSKDEAAYSILSRFAAVDRYSSSETEIALSRIDPKRYIDEAKANADRLSYHVAAAAFGQGLAEISALKDESLNAEAGKKMVEFFGALLTQVPVRKQPQMLKALSSLSQSLARLKPSNMESVFKGNLTSTDVQVKAAAAEILGGMPPTVENKTLISKAFTLSLVTDKMENDAQLALLDAIFKLDKRLALKNISEALDAPDYIVRRRAIELLKTKEAWKGLTAAELAPVIAKAETGKDIVRPFTARSKTRMGQVLNKNLDYRRALTRKNGSIKAVLTTQKGTFTIDLFPEDAPLTVDNFVKLARIGYFNGLEVHRVVPNFVMQDGDPRGDGNGGPGWSIRCEMNMREFGRGAVGMALSGKDTGGSQWFVTHAPQPHLDGGYTVFGQVSESDMKVVDNIVRGDKILSVRIFGK